MPGVETTSAAMREIVLASQGDLPSNRLLAHVCRVVSRRFGFERIAILRYHEQLGEIAVVAVVGEARDSILQPVPIHEVRALGKALETQQVVFVDDSRDGGEGIPRAVAAFGITPAFCVPLLSSGRCLGFLVGDRRGARFELGEHELAALDMIGVVTATLLEKVLVTEEMERLDAMKSEFIAVASHELRTPLTSVYGISVTLDERGQALTQPELIELRRTLREQSERLRALVDQLLDLSRFDVAGVKVSPAATPVAATLRDVVDVVAPREAVTIDVDPELTAWVDPVALDRIASNLVANAVRYGAPPITISAAAGDGRVRVAVEDRGAGVAEDFVPRLFERFARSDASSQTAGGSGLGLAIARAYARAHGGDLVYEHARPTGARFVVTLPTEPPARPEPTRSTRRRRTGTAAFASKLGPVVVSVSPPEAARALRDLLDDYHAVLAAADRVEIEPVDEVRRGTVIYRVVQVSQAVAEQFEDAVMYFIAEDGNPWRIPPPPP